MLRTAVQVCLTRNAARIGYQRVPDDVIQRMDHSFDWPPVAAGPGWESQGTLCLYADIASSPSASAATVARWMWTLPIAVPADNCTKTGHTSSPTDMKIVDNHLRALVCQFIPVYL